MASLFPYYQVQFIDLMTAPIAGLVCDVVRCASSMMEIHTMNVGKPSLKELLKKKKQIFATSLVPEIPKIQMMLKKMLKKHLRHCLKNNKQKI